MTIIESKQKKSSSFVMKRSNILEERQRIIVELIRKGVADDVALNVAVNTKYLSEKLNVNRKTIQRDVAYLQERKLIQWVGSDKTGHWEVKVYG